MGIWLHTTAAIFTGLRNGLSIVFIPLIAVEIFGNFKKRLWKSVILGVVSMLMVFCITTLPRAFYPGEFVQDAANYPLSIQNIATWIDLGSPALNYLLAFPLLLVSHLIMLLGFREAAFTQFPRIFLPLNFINLLQILISLALVIIHATGLVKFYQFFGNRDKRVFVFLVYVLPSLLFAAHMRYFIALIPFSLLGIALICDKKLVHSLKG